jgi:hypothetical protein
MTNPRGISGYNDRREVAHFAIREAEAAAVEAHHEVVARVPGQRAGLIIA